jgi:hypothetical protein
MLAPLASWASEGDLSEKSSAGIQVCSQAELLRAASEHHLTRKVEVSPGLEHPQDVTGEQLENND